MNRFITAAVLTATALVMGYLWFFGFYAPERAKMLRCQDNIAECEVG